MQPEDNRWFVFADEDLRMAELAFHNEMFNQVCFHRGIPTHCRERCLTGCLRKTMPKRRGGRRPIS